MSQDIGPKLGFTDANVTIGHPGIPKYRTEADPAALEARLGELGITAALVRHSASFDGHPTEGNAMLDRALGDPGPLEPVWAVMPHWTGEFPSPDRLRSEMAAKGIRAVVAFPLQHGFPLRESVCGPLLAMLEERRVPFFLPAPQADLGAVEGVLDRHPKLPVVLSDTSYRLARELYPLLEHYPALHLEISGYMVHRGIEDIHRRFGSERMIFGTRFPHYNPGCAVAAVLYADVPLEAKALIASGNIRKLLGAARLA